jgi:spore coat protein CotH
MVGTGHKRSLNLTLDLAHKDQHIGGYRTLNLLNAHEDPTYLRPILFLEIARDYLPASKGNLARVVINGENWGIYNNVEQFNKDFVKEWRHDQGARWKVRGNWWAGRLTYLSDDPEDYKRIYTIKTRTIQGLGVVHQNVQSSQRTPRTNLNKRVLCSTLTVLSSLDNVLINNDGYWIRTSDYSIYQDVKGRFHIIPADVNETFAKPGGPGFGGGRGGGPGMMLAPQMLSQGDKNADQKLTKSEMTALADAWFEKLDADQNGKLTQDQFAERFDDSSPPPGFGPPGGGAGSVPDDLSDLVSSQPRMLPRMAHSLATN